MKRFLIILIFVAAVSALPAAAQGLKFNSAEAPIDKRTSYDIFHSVEPRFEDTFDLEFEMQLYPITEIGYVLRIKNHDSNKIYNLFYDGRGDDFFKFNEEGKSTLIVAHIDRQALLDAHWFKVKLSFDMAADSIGIAVHDRTFGASNVGLRDECSPQIVFGRSDHVIDVPSFAIRNISVGNSHNRYSFSLCQSEGDEVYDSKGRPVGRVENPEWLINNAYHWQRKKTSFASIQAAGAGYNPVRKEIYYFNRDSLSTYNVRTEASALHLFDRRCPVQLVLGTNFVDADRNKLYAYEVYYGDDSSAAGCPTVASLDLDTYRWSPECYDELPNQLHHHTMYFDADRGRYTIYGGFGNMSYSRYFRTYSIADHHWTTEPPFEGDQLYSRYFSSMGYFDGNNSLYVFGGMGNESGEQAVGRFYLYDLHRIDLTSGRIEKLWEIPWNGPNTVPVRGMIVNDEHHFYTLCYSESVSNSHLKLYRFSIDDGSYEILGDSIPIRSDKIATNANLYYDKQMNEIYATVQESPDDVRSTLTVYALSFPPLTAEGLAEMTKPERVVRYWLSLTILAVLVIAAAVLFFTIRRRRRLAAERLALVERRNYTEMEIPVVSNSIMLFGDFTVRDRNNKDITYLFTASQKQTFCLIMQHSCEEGVGISSQRLSDLLWPDKPEKKAKNSRGVAIKHLRDTLSMIDGVQLLFEKGCFKIVTQQPFYCDYMRCMEILNEGSLETERRDELMGILARGKFLKSMNIPMFDTFKNDVERKLEPILQIELEKSFSEGNYQMSINFAEAVFNIDPLNDDALIFMLRSLHKLHREEDALIKFKAFSSEYRNTFGSDYPRSYKSIV